MYPDLDVTQTINILHSTNIVKRNQTVNNSKRFYKRMSLAMIILSVWVIPEQNFNKICANFVYTVLFDRQVQF